MADPVSPMAAIGFAFSCVSFAFTIVPNIIKTAAKMKECEDKLRRMFQSLSSAFLTLREWAEKWHHYSLSEYKVWWGDGMYEEVDRRLQDIFKLAPKIMKSIGELDPDVAKHFPRSSNERTEGRRTAEETEQSFQRHWCLLLDGPGLEITPQMHANVGNRLAFALWKDTQIEGMVKDLDGVVQRMVSLTEASYDRLLSRSRKIQLHREELRQSKGLLETVGKLSKFAEAVYRGNLSDDMTWLLELRNIGDGDEEYDDFWEHMEDTYKIPLDLILLQKNHQSLFKRIRIPYNQGVETEAALNFCRSIVTYAREQNNAGPTFGLCEPRATLTERSYPFSELLLKGQILNRLRSVDRATLMLALAQWILLLWNTTWTSTPCTCCIRLYREDEHSTLGPHSLGTTINKSCHAIDDAPVTTSGHNCHDADSAPMRLVHLGIVLSELAIATRLRLELRKDQSSSNGYQNSEIVVKECKFDEQGKEIQTELHRAELLSRVRESTLSHKVYKAIKFCLYDDQSQGLSKLRMDTLPTYKSIILDPLIEYRGIALNRERDVKPSMMEWAREMHDLFEPIQAPS